MTDDATGEMAACGVWVFLSEGYCVEDEYVNVGVLFVGRFGGGVGGGGEGS